MMVIYKIKIKGHSNFYIGSAIDFHKRKLHHLNQLKRSTHRNMHLQRCFDKYGEKAFDFVILEEVCDKSLLLEKEQQWIDRYPFGELINICPTAGSSLGRKHTDETKAKISKNHHDVSGENNPMFGVPSPNKKKIMSQEQRRKISKALKGRTSPTKGTKRPKHSERMSGKNNPFYGEKHSDETKRKISKKRKELARSKGGQKLTIELVREIREKYSKKDVTITALAKEYGLSRTYCGLLLREVYWKEN